MKINNIYIDNFRGFTKFSQKFHPNFNVIIGENGSGKTALLEALCVSAGSFLLGIDPAEAKGISTDDIHHKLLHNQLEPQTPVIIDTQGEVYGKPMNWKRERLNTSRRGWTTRKEATEITALAKTKQKEFQIGIPVILPVLAYYSTERLWKDRDRNRQNTLRERTKPEKRIDGYYNALDRSSNNLYFNRWFKSKEAAALTKENGGTGLQNVKSALIKCIEHCDRVVYDFDLEQIIVRLKNDDGMFSSFLYSDLSDGYRNLLTLVADIAFRCTILNPHLGNEALLETNGIVLIDELDLHLHPKWQKSIVGNLKKIFPKIQFITTTHSPFIIQSLEKNELINLDHTIVTSDYYQQSIEDIAENVQSVENPQYSKKKLEMYEAAKQYYQLLNSMNINTSDEELERIRLHLDELSRPYAENVAYYAFLEQKKLIKELEIGKNEAGR